MVLVSLPLLAVICGGQHGLTDGDLDLHSQEVHLLAVPIIDQFIKDPCKQLQNILLPNPLYKVCLRQTEKPTYRNSLQSLKQQETFLNQTLSFTF